MKKRRPALALPQPPDLTSVETMWHLAAPCPPWLKQAWIDLLGAEKVWELYRGTEMQAMTAIRDIIEANQR